MRQNRQFQSLDSSNELLEIYLHEEIFAERRINRISLAFSGFYLIFSLFINFITHLKFSSPNSLSNTVGISLVLVYHIILYFVLEKNLYHWAIKYLTVFITTTMITLILYGYHFGVDFVHSTRSVTVSSYFIAIVLSGLYQHPRVSLFTALVASLEYTFLYIAALMDGVTVFFQVETFRYNQMSWDVLVVFVVLFSSSGLLLFIYSKRQQLLLNKLLQEQENHRLSEQKANYLENYDGLTQLPNLVNFRRELEGQIVKAANRDQIFSLMCLGLDSFNNINQLHGTDTGNSLLRQVSRRLITGYREGDLVCRFMGDKFLILFTDLKSDYNLSDLIKKTKAVFDTPFPIGKGMIKLSASGGLCTYPNDADNPDDLIKKSESAMYDAKKTGKNSFTLFDKHNQEELELYIRIEKELETAVQNHEFHLVYQPKVDSEGRIIGLECLLRWDNGHLGSVSPDVFIPIAEKSGLIVPVGYEVFRICCQQVSNWQQKGIRRFRTSVNVSPAQFAQKDIVEKIEEIIRSSGADPSWLGIEITESGIMKNEEECIRKLDQLRELGLRISMDDFGTGYSSLSRLGNYPIHTLKIDKSFVDDLPHSNVSVCLVRSILDLAQNLNYAVVAEGVETAEQIEFLKENGCRVFQGYYYYKPMPAGEVDGYLTAGS